MGERLEPLISARRIRLRVAALARQIEADHAGAPVTLLVVLKGATVFAADLMRQLAIPFVIDFVSASSYRGATTRSAGEVLIRNPGGLDLRGHHVILVEDIVDTGLTISRIIDTLRRLDPAGIDVCALLHKQVAGARPVDIRYKGFDIPDTFVVGYGMDYDERLRNLPGVHRLILDGAGR
jgi:hypoxanthine phosphoribosyltransferase